MQSVRSSEDENTEHPTQVETPNQPDAYTEGGTVVGIAGAVVQVEGVMPP